MARIPATTHRAAKNVRNGPSKWQQKLHSLVRETRWIAVLLLVAWLSMILFSWNSSDPGWSQSVDTGAIHNKGGKIGAYMADILYYLFGYSAWWWVILLVRHLIIGFYRIPHSILARASKPAPIPLFSWTLVFTFILLLLGSMGFETLLQLGSHLPAGAGGQLGQLLASGLVLYLGLAGAVISLLLAFAIGLSGVFRFSWLKVAEYLGQGLEWLYLDLSRRLQQWRVQKQNSAPKQTQNTTPSESLEPIRATPAVSKVSERAEPTLGERKEPTLGSSWEHTQAAGLESQPATEPVRKYPHPVFDEPAAVKPVGATSVAAEAEIIVEAPDATVAVESVANEPSASTHAIHTQTQATVAKAVVQHVDMALPPLDLLDPAPEIEETISAETLDFTSRLIEKKLSDFGVNVTVMEAQSGPVITRYEIEPATGVKGNQIVNLSKDLARSLSLIDIRVVETIPGKNLMGLELPNPKRQMVRLEEIVGSTRFVDNKSLLTVALGKDIAGHAVVADLARMPHLLVAGTTGSGKSVGINAMILSVLYKATPDQVRLILIDPKMLEMSVYEDIPHLLAPVVTDMKHAANALTWCVNEMERRYKLMSKMGVRNLAGFNTKIQEARQREEPIPNPFSLTPDAPEPLDSLPFIVVVIDELADLMMVEGKRIEELIARLAQKARAAGIHLVLATQRPSVDVITGLIKANIPTRISFQVSSKVDSRTILDQMGAETLLGQGDMLYLPPGTSVPIRVHGAFVDDDEVHRVVEYLKAQGEPDYIEGILEGAQGETGDGVNAITGFADAESDPLYDQAVAVVLESGRASASGVQRQLRVGYNRAARLMDEMEKAGIVSAMGPGGTREILVPIAETK